MGIANRIVVLVSGWLVAISAHANARAEPIDPKNFFDCGGTLESRVWRLWESDGAPLAQVLLNERLIRQGDTYALYDFEIYFHNLLSMALRCGRVERQRGIAALIRQTYSQRSAIGPLASSAGWVCRGGSVCNSRNGLVDTEVMLPSVQFIAFAMNLANDLVQHGAGAADMEFIAETTRIALEHLHRWNDARSRLLLNQRIAARPGDVKDGSSRLFMSDKDLWQIVIYAEVAGVLSKHPMLLGQRLDEGDMASMQTRMVLLLQLFKRRTFATGLAQAGERAEETGTDLDRGFWRLYPDNRYAGYDGVAAPVRCLAEQTAANGRQKMKVEVPPPAPVQDLGWDLSHARRWVALFDAVQRNERAIESFYSIPLSLLPGEEVARGFARQLRVKVWNQDSRHPLFRNYTSGANDWYRVAYDNGANGCTEGIAPFGLSGAFVTGGYPVWGRWDVGLRNLARRLYLLSDSKEERDVFFMEQAYPLLTHRSSNQVRARSELMFWPALVTKSP